MDNDSIIAELQPSIHILIEAYYLFEPRKQSFLNKFFYGPGQMHFFDSAYVQELVTKKVRIRDYIRTRVPPDNETTPCKQVVPAMIHTLAQLLIEQSSVFSLKNIRRALEDLKKTTTIMEDCEFILDNEDLFKLSDTYEFTNMLKGSVPKEYYSRRNEILRLLIEAQNRLKQTTRIY